MQVILPEEQTKEIQLFVANLIKMRLKPLKKIQDKLVLF